MSGFLSTEQLESFLIPLSEDSPAGEYLKDNRQLYRPLRNAYNIAQTSLQKLSLNPDPAELDELLSSNRENWEQLESMLLDGAARERALNRITDLTGMNMTDKTPIPGQAASHLRTIVEAATESAFTVKAPEQPLVTESRETPSESFQFPETTEDSGQETPPARLRQSIRVAIALEQKAGLPFARSVGELPFVVGVIGELCGDKPENQKEEVDFRNFIDIDKDNFDTVMGTVDPQLDLKVDNKRADDDSEMSVSPSFSSMRDFEPANVIQQVEPLKKLLDIRNQLRELHGPC